MYPGQMHQYYFDPTSQSANPYLTPYRVGNYYNTILGERQFDPFFPQTPQPGPSLSQPPFTPTGQGTTVIPPTSQPGPPWGPPPFAPTSQGIADGPPWGQPSFAPPGQGPTAGPPMSNLQFAPPGQGPTARPPFGPPPFAPPGQGLTDGPPFGHPPFTSPGHGHKDGPPTSPPPSFVPSQQVQSYAVDPGGIARCLYRYTYVWLRGFEQFWFYPTHVGRNSVSGYRWSGFRWIYFGIDLRQIQSFTCY